MQKTIIIVSLLLFVGYMAKLITSGVIFKRYKKPFVITKKSTLTQMVMAISSKN
jgi:hypothetical protein